MRRDSDSDPGFEGSDGRRLVIVFVIVTLIAAAFFATSLIEAYTGDRGDPSDEPHDGSLGAPHYVDASAAARSGQPPRTRAQSAATAAS